MEWKRWLTRWSEEWVRSADAGELDPQVLGDRWLGFAPATPEAVVAAEARLGHTLPPSYREFLLTTDGWRNAGGFVWRMRDSTNLEWLRDIEPFWEESWSSLYDEHADGDSGNPLSRGLIISLEADAGILLLDPGEVDDAGEWAAYSLFSWRAAPPTRFASFTALMEDLYAEFHQMRHPEGETRDEWDLRVEQARSDALAGDVDGAEAILAQAEKFGRNRATVLRAQLLLVLGRDYEAGQLVGRLLHPSFQLDGFLSDPLFTDEFMPWLYAEHTKNASPGRRSILQLALIGDRPEIKLAIGEHENRLQDSAGSLTFGNPEFDVTVRRALAEHSDDPDALWAAVLKALVHWRPRTIDHVAPVALLADPALATTLTRERGRELLSRPRGGH